MTDFYFERYEEQAEKALEAHTSAVSNGVLIEGIEDIGGIERLAIARAVPKEAVLMAKALRTSGVQPLHTIEQSPLIPGTFKGPVFRKGWGLGKLVDGAPYIEGGLARHETDANALLDESGQIYAYAPGMIGSIPVANGIALNRYAPSCATSMNDRAVLYGLATLAVRHDLDVQPTPINA